MFKDKKAREEIAELKKLFTDAGLTPKLLEIKYLKERAKDQYNNFISHGFSNILKKLEALEKYLGIEYKVEDTHKEGYVKVKKEVKKQ